MQCSIKIVDGKTTINLESNISKIIDLKIDGEDLKISKKTEDGKTTIDLEIDSSKTINLKIDEDSTGRNIRPVLCHDESMQIFVMIMRKMVFTLKVKEIDTIYNVKAMVQDQVGFVVDKQRLFFEGCELEDCLTIADYNIMKGSTILLVPSVKLED